MKTVLSSGHPALMLVYTSCSVLLGSIDFLRHVVGMFTAPGPTRKIGGSIGIASDNVSTLR